MRIGLQDVKGMSGAERETLVGNRPYASLDDLRLRAGLSRPTAVNLCKAGALDALSGTDGHPDRRRTMLAVEELWSGARRTPRVGSEAVQARLDLHADHRPQLPTPTDADAVRDELEVLGLDWSRHVVAFYEPLLGALGVTRAHELLQRRDGEDGRGHRVDGRGHREDGRGHRVDGRGHREDGRGDGEVVRVAGVRAALQSPPVRSGQRVLFLSLDDRTGTTQCNFFESVLETEAWTVLNSWLVVVEGRLRRSGPRGATVLGNRAWDLTELWRAWGRGELEAALARRGPPPVHRRADRRPAGLSAAMFASGSR